MRGTMLRDDSINNEGALSRSRHDLHLKAYRRIRRKRQTGIFVRQLTFPPSSPAISHRDEMRARKLTQHLSTLGLLSALWWHRGHNPCYSAPSHTEIVEQRAVKGVYALSLGGIKDAEGLKGIKVGAMLPRLPPACISLWAGVKFSVPGQKSREVHCKTAWGLVTSSDAAKTKYCKMWFVCLLHILCTVVCVGVWHFTTHGDELRSQTWSAGHLEFKLLHYDRSF